METDTDEVAEESQSADLTLARPFTTATSYDPKVKADAYEKFLNSDMDLTDLAIYAGVSKSVIAAWSKSGGWAKRKEDLELELMRSAESKYRGFLMEYKLPTVIRHIETARLLEEQIAKILQAAAKEGGEINSTELRRLSEALASATSVSARAVGMGEKNVSEQVARQDPSNGKRPLIAIGITPRLSEAMDVRVVETTCEDVTNG